MTFRVLIPQRVAPEGITALRAAGLEAVEAPSTDSETLRELIQGCDAVLTRTTPLTAELLSAAPRLKVIARHGVGVDHIDLDYCRNNDIQVTFSPEANVIPVAEHTLMLILAITKNVLVTDTEIRKGNFSSRNSEYGIELAGKTLGVVGLGRIGRLVADGARAGLGMKILGFDPYADQGTLGQDIQLASLQTLLAESDVISVHVPLTPETRGLFSAERFSQMKQGTYLVNCSRGGVVDEDALELALLSGRVRAAGLDVFAEEPLPEGHPLTELPNVVLTPHMAAHTEASMIRMAVHAAEGIISVARGEEPRWPVRLAPPLNSVEVQPAN